MKKSMYLIPALALVLSAGSAKAATEFSEHMLMKRVESPGVADLAGLDNYCSTQAASMEARVKAIEANKSFGLQAVYAEASVQMTSSQATGMSYSCSVTLSGSADQKVKFITLSERINHLGHKGFKKSEYDTACDSISQAYSMNSNEVVQISDIAFTAVQGNYCEVTSTVLTAKP